MNYRYPGTRKKCKLSACRNRARILHCFLATTRFLARLRDSHHLQIEGFLHIFTSFKARILHAWLSTIAIFPRINVILFQTACCHTNLNLFLKNFSKDSLYSRLFPVKDIGFEGHGKKKKPGQKCNMKKCENSSDTILLLHTYDYTSITYMHIFNFLNSPNSDANIFST